MVTRTNVRSLGSEERAALVNAFLFLKKKGRYDEYVHWHHAVMNATVFPYEPRDPDYRNGAHRGPAFLPWHREFLMQVEADLRAIDSKLFVPYWDWTQDAASSATASPVWADDLMGGNGLESIDWRVGTGPFAYEKGNWNIPLGQDGPALKRRFAATVPTLPSREDLALAMAEAFYDTPPFTSSPFTLGFRNRLEGWITQRGDSRVKLPGSQLHNRVHLWVGGSMEPMTSPNDPIFFLHHCFVDKIWSDWQAQQLKDNPSAAPHYAPESSGPLGHNLHDQLNPWQRTIRETLDISKLGYSYEQPPTQPEFMALVARIKRRSEFSTTRSPFMAD